MVLAFFFWVIFFCKFIHGYWKGASNTKKNDYYSRYVKSKKKGYIIDQQMMVNILLWVPGIYMKTLDSLSSLTLKPFVFGCLCNYQYLIRLCWDIYWYWRLSFSAEAQFLKLEYISTNYSFFILFEAAAVKKLLIKVFY